MSIKTYSELIRLPSFEERFRYLRLNGKVGDATFGSDRWANQELYHSGKWLRFRDKVIIRDNGCDLAVDDFEIFGMIIIHHIVPITYDDIVNQNPCVFDFNNVVATSHSTHNAIHYRDESLLIRAPIERRRNDMCPWKR